jgi:hypothetical protein
MYDFLCSDNFKYLGPDTETAADVHEFAGNGTSGKLSAGVSPFVGAIADGSCNSAVGTRLEFSSALIS